MGIDCTQCCEASNFNYERSRQHSRRIAKSHKMLRHPYIDQPIAAEPVFQENKPVEAMENNRVSWEGESQDHDSATYKVKNINLLDLKDNLDYENLVHNEIYDTIESDRSSYKIDRM